MVWKKSIIFVVGIAFALVLAMPIHAKAVSPYSEGNISTTYLTYFRDILQNISVNDDYVFYRSGQYEYIAFVGKLEYENGSFTGTNLKAYIMTQTNSGYSSLYIYDVLDGQSLTLTPGSILVYSNLGDYPDLIERGVFLETSEIILLLVGLCAYLLRSIFAFCYRSRS